MTREAVGWVVRTRVGAADSAQCVDVTYRWDFTDEIALRVELVPSSDWDCTWPRVGVRFDLPATLRDARWFGTGPHESYPDSSRAARVGRFTADLDELNVRYSRPQETGHRPQLRALELATAAASGSGCARCPAPAAIGPASALPRTPRRRSSGPAHPHELGPAARTYLFLDDAVHGLGSAACGPDVAPEHALWPGERAFAVVFEEPA